MKTRNRNKLVKPLLNLEAFAREVLKILLPTLSTGSLRWWIIREELSKKLSRDVSTYEIKQTLLYCKDCGFVSNYYEWYKITASGREELELYNMVESLGCPENL